MKIIIAAQTITSPNKIITPEPNTLTAIIPITNSMTRINNNIINNIIC